MAERTKTRFTSRAGRAFWWRAILIVAGVVAILAATVTPLPGSGADGPPWCPSCPAFSNRAGVDFVENVLLYGPFGAALGFAGVSTWLGSLLGLGLSAIIETLQVSVIPGRFATASDVVGNGLGTLLGLIVGRYWRFLLMPPPVASRRLLGAASALMVGTIGLISWGRQPAIDDTETTIRIHPRTSHTSSARVIAVSVDGRSVTDGSRLPPNRLRRALENDPLRIAVSFLPTTVREDEPPSVEIVDGRGRSIVALSEESRNVRLELATRADGLRLHRTFARARRLLPSRAARARALTAGALDTVHAYAAVSRQLLRVEAQSGRAAAMGDYRRGIDVGWSLFVQQHGSPRRIALMSALWVALFALPLGYWAARTPGATSKRRQPSMPQGVIALAFVALTFVVALMIMPALTGSAAASVWQWVAALVGATLGGGAARAMKQLAARA